MRLHALAAVCRAALLGLPLCIASTATAQPDEPETDDADAEESEEGDDPDEPALALPARDVPGLPEGGSQGIRYELLGRLAVGGMAELYLARAHEPSGR